METAVSSPGRWVEVRSDFKTRANARVTGDCLEAGYLRVLPQEGDEEVEIAGKRYIATAAPVSTRIEQVGERWRLRIRRDL